MALAGAVWLSGCDGGSQTRVERPASGGASERREAESAKRAETVGDDDSGGRPRDARNTRPVSADRVRLLRQAVDACGGVLRCDADGQPVEVDFVAPRAVADQAAFSAIVACPSLRTVRLIAGQVSADELSRLGQLPALEQLVLQDTRATDATLQTLANGCRRLHRLTLRNAPGVTDAGLAALARFPELTHLALIDLPITGAALREVAGLPRLVSLDLRSCSGITAADLSLLARMPHLKELKLGGFGVNDETLAVVVRLPHLESLTVEDADLHAAGLRQLASSDAAGRIRLLSFARCASLDDEALATLRAFAALRHLSLRDVPVTGRFLAGQPWLDQLEVLILNQTFLTDEGFKAIAACRNLKRLELVQNALSAEAMEAIASLSRLEVLNLSECGLTDEMLQPLARLTRLRTLITDGNPELSVEAVRAVLNGENHGAR